LGKKNQAVDAKKEAFQKDSRIRGTKGQRNKQRKYSKIRRLLQKKGLQDQADKRME
jgi:hypothetical protein